MATSRRVDLTADEIECMDKLLQDYPNGMSVAELSADCYIIFGSSSSVFVDRIVNGLPEEKFRVSNGHISLVANSPEASSPEASSPVTNSLMTSSTGPMPMRMGKWALSSGSDRYHVVAEEDDGDAYARMKEQEELTRNALVKRAEEEMKPRVKRVPVTVPFEGVPRDVGPEEEESKPKPQKKGKKSLEEWLWMQKKRFS